MAPAPGLLTSFSDILFVPDTTKQLNAVGDRVIPVVQPRRVPRGKGVTNNPPGPQVSARTAPGILGLTVTCQ